MLCKKPFRTLAGEFGCGQCMPCRINRRRLWTARILLESGRHCHNAFVTLTYRDAVVGPPRGNLEARDVELFWKRLRKAYPVPLRYFAVGEYGEKSQRPHYHAAVFGLSFLDSVVVEVAWGRGFVHVGELNTASAQYIAGYVCKKMTGMDDPRLGGRMPEFARMSLRPGIGQGAAAVIAAGLVTEGGCNALVKMVDVPHEVRIQGRKYPLGRYVRKHLREEVGWSGEVPRVARQLLAVQDSSYTVLERVAREKKRADAERVAVGRYNLERSKRRL